MRWWRRGRRRRQGESTTQANVAGRRRDRIPFLLVGRNPLHDTLSTGNFGLFADLKTASPNPASPVLEDGTTYEGDAVSPGTLRTGVQHLDDGLSGGDHRSLLPRLCGDDPAAHRQLLHAPRPPSWAPPVGRGAICAGSSPPVPRPPTAKSSYRPRRPSRDVVGHLPWYACASGRCAALPPPSAGRGVSRRAGRLPSTTTPRAGRRRDLRAPYELPPRESAATRGLRRLG